MCCLWVLDSVTSTPQWIRQPRPRVYLKQPTFLCQRIGVSAIQAINCRPILSRHYASMMQEGLQIAGPVHWGCYYPTALDIEVDPQRRRASPTLPLSDW